MDALHDWMDGLHGCKCYSLTLIKHWDDFEHLPIHSYWILIQREGLSTVEDVGGTKAKVDIEIGKLRAHDSEASGKV